MTNFNHMISYKRNKLATKEKYFKKCLSLEKKNFDPTKVNILDQKVGLKHPITRMNELDDVKVNNRRYRDWKNKFLFTKRKFKNHKQRMRSGILSIDNPNESDTTIYKDEYAKEAKKRKKSKKIKDRYKKNIGLKRMTH